MEFDARVIGFCAAAAVVAGLLFGIAPAWQATALSAASAMTSDSRTTTSGRGGLRGLLVVGEVATAVILLFGAGLLLRTLLAVETVDRGYRAESALTMMSSTGAVITGRVNSVSTAPSTVMAADRWSAAGISTMAITSIRVTVIGPSVSTQVDGAGQFTLTDVPPGTCS